MIAGNAVTVIKKLCPVLGWRWDALLFYPSIGPSSLLKLLLIRVAGGLQPCIVIVRTNVI